MIKFEKTTVYGFEEAIRAMRNPTNSHSLSDSRYPFDFENYEYITEIGEKDKNFIRSLIINGTEYNEFRRMILVYVDITAPLYWWKEFDIYRTLTIPSSTYTIHVIQDKPFTLSDFSHEDLIISNRETVFCPLLEALEKCRQYYNKYKHVDPAVAKVYWRQIIQLLPDSYNQKSSVSLSYETLSSIWHYCKNYKLDEWHVGFIDFIKGLPFSWIITGEDE